MLFQQRVNQLRLKDAVVDLDRANPNAKAHEQVLSELVDGIVVVEER